MEIQLQELIEQIKKDGVERAEIQASAILDEAKKEAERIVLDANVEAEKIRKSAKEDADKFMHASEEAVRQAGRNLLISFRARIAKELEYVICDKVTALYNSEALEKMIIAVVEGLAQNPDVDDVAVLLKDTDKATLENSLTVALKERLKKEVTLKVSDNFSGGFRIAVNNGTIYYDYSAEAVIEMLSTYLTPKIIALLKEAEGV